MDDIFKRLKELEEGNSNNRLYVYYEPSNGKVIHIRNYEEIDIFPYISVLETEFGEENRDLNNYRVIEKQGEFKLVKKDNIIIKYDVDNDIHLIKKISKEEFEKDTDFDILIRQERKLKKLKKIHIELSKELVFKLSQSWVENERMVVMFITAENDPNILYSTVKFKLQDLIDAGVLAIQLTGYDPSLPCDIVTKKIFNNYKHLEL
jgi:hypothetical protein